MDPTVIVALIGSMTTILSILIPIAVNRRKKKSFRDYPASERPKLKHHPLFSELDRIERDFMMLYDSGDLGRTKLAVELMVHKIRLTRPILLKLAEDMQKCFESCSSGTHKCNKVLNRNMEAVDAVRTAYTMWHKQRDSTGGFIPLYDVYDRLQYRSDCRDSMDIYVKKFSDWNSIREKSLIQSVKDYSYSAVSIDCYDKQHDIFTSWMTMYNQLKLDTEKTLKALNGELTGLSFLGTIIGDIEH